MSFISFSYLIALGLRLPKLCWIKVRLGILVLFLILKEKLLALLNMMLTVRLSYVAFILLMYIPSLPTLLRVFIIHGCWNLVECFCCIYWYNLTIFIFHVAHIAWLVHVEHFLYSWKKIHMIMVYKPLNVWLNSVCQYYWRFLCFYLSGILAFNFLFLGNPCLVLVLG